MEKINFTARLKLQAVFKLNERKSWIKTYVNRTL
jgi:hypothetical protein